MKYFVNYEEWKALGGTNYFEFQEGRFNNKFWLENSTRKFYLYSYGRI